VLEISRSGKGSHAWIFFTEPVPAREARQLGAALISHTCDRTRQLSLASYDRLLANQDTMPKGGFGNLIALPLQKQRLAVQKSQDLFQNGFAGLSGLIPEQRHRDGFGFTETELWPVNGTAFTVFGDFNLNG
jgi:hypothetical protein